MTPITTGQRWFLRACFTLGAGASLAANMLHAEPSVISRIIGAWPPLALLLTVEILARYPVRRPWLATLRIAVAAAIAGIAAWVSYSHMVELIRQYGETGAAPYLIPLSVDGLMIVASIGMVELSTPAPSTPAVTPERSPKPEPTPEPAPKTPAPRGVIKAAAAAAIAATPADVDVDVDELVDAIAQEHPTANRQHIGRTVRAILEGATA